MNNCEFISQHCQTLFFTPKLKPSCCQMEETERQLMMLADTMRTHRFFLVFVFVLILSFFSLRLKKKEIYIELLHPTKLPEWEKHCQRHNGPRLACPDPKFSHFWIFGHQMTPLSLFHCLYWVFTIWDRSVRVSLFFLLVQPNIVQVSF